MKRKCELCGNEADERYMKDGLVYWECKSEEKCKRRQRAKSALEAPAANLVGFADETAVMDPEPYKALTPESFPELMDDIVSTVYPEPEKKPATFPVSLVTPTPEPSEDDVTLEVKKVHTGRVTQHHVICSEHGDVAHRNSVGSALIARHLHLREFHTARAQ